VIIALLACGTPAPDHLDLFRGDRSDPDFRRFLRVLAMDPLADFDAREAQGEGRRIAYADASGGAPLSGAWLLPALLDWDRSLYVRHDADDSSSRFILVWCEDTYGARPGQAAPGMPPICSVPDPKWPGCPAHRSEPMACGYEYPPGRVVVVPEAP
jgi:hypothetical protein